MPNFTITGFSSTAQTLNLAEFGVVTKDGELIVTTGNAITADGSHFMTLNGTVVAQGSSSFNAVDFDGDNLHTYVGPNAFILATNSDTFNIYASGTVRFSNAGTILSGSDAVDIGHSDGAINLSMSNSGLIQAESDGVLITAGSSSSSFINTGTVIGQEGYGVIMNWEPGDTGATLLRNTGTITGERGSFDVESGTGDNTIVNDGVMNGEIIFGSGNDLYLGGGGKVSGTVFGENDNDTLRGGAFTDIFDGGSGDDELVGRGGDDDLFGGSGFDLILGGAGNDLMMGGLNDDTLNGNSGDDTIYGDDGNDILRGQDGTDVLDGGANDDILDGGAGDDVLEGKAGADVLRGRSGEDQLAGGSERDLMFGGADADLFIFRSLADAGNGVQRDVIADFEQGIDLINVAGLAAGVFDFLGTGGFNGTGSAELRLVETASGSTTIRMDADGNGSVDAEIRVVGVVGLTADDFAL